MYHPLLENPTSLKDSDLENRIFDLTNKYHIAARMGNGSVCQQIIIILETLRTEQQKRSADMLKKTQQSNQNKNLDDLINVT